MFENNEKMVVLIVDDNPNNLKMLIDFLKESGFKLVVAQNGNEALARVKINKPHIILLDIMMPGLDGYETCKQLKSDEKYKDIPIIFMTALSDTGSKIKAFEVGAVDYITKPFNQEEILARVKTHITLQCQRQELFELNAMKNLFLSIIAHDIRSSINPLYLGTDLLSRMVKQFNDEKLTMFVTTLKKSAENANKLMENLLQWSRLHRGQMKYKPIKLNMKSLVFQITELLSDKIIDKKISIQQNITTDITAFGDYNMVNTIVRNLLSNAIKFTNPEGKIIITVYINQDDMVEFAIKDNGVGIDKKVQKKLFSIDHQFKMIGTAGENGTGLGLKLCYDLISKNKGNIWIESEINEGTCIYFTLPMV